MSGERETRTCKRCGRLRSLSRFYRIREGSYRWTCIDCLRAADNQQRRERGAPKRHQRYNARNEIWCNSCQRYLPAESFRRHPTRPGKWWAYCRDCTQRKDRERYARRTGTLESALRDLEKRSARKRRKRANETAERQGFVQTSISILLRRGLTKAEICRLTDTSFGSLLSWARGERRVTPAVGERFAILMRETAYLRAGDEPAYRRRRPHPDMPMLLERCRPQMHAHPVRSRWVATATRKDDHR